MTPALVRNEADHPIQVRGATLGAGQILLTTSSEEYIVASVSPIGRGEILVFASFSVKSQFPGIEVFVSINHSIVWQSVAPDSFAGRYYAGETLIIEAGVSPHAPHADPAVIALDLAVFQVHRDGSLKRLDGARDYVPSDMVAALLRTPCVEATVEAGRTSMLTRKWLTTRADAYLSDHPHDSDLLRKILGQDLSSFICESLNRQSATAENCRLESRDKNYVILFTPRSGSTVLSEYIAATEMLGYPIEFFVEWIARAVDLLRPNSTQSLLEFVAEVFRSPSGVFGLEIEWERLQQELEFFDQFRGWTVFYLTRRDKIMQAISLRRAMRGAIWHSLSTGTTEPNFDREDIVGCLNRLLRYEMNFESLFRDLNIEPHRMYYEEMQDDVIIGARVVARGLEMEHSVNWKHFNPNIASKITRTPNSERQAIRVMAEGGAFYGYDISEADGEFVAVLAGLDRELMNLCVEPLIFRAGTWVELKSAVERALIDLPQHKVTPHPALAWAGHTAAASRAT